MKKHTFSKAVLADLATMTLPEVAAKHNVSYSALYNHCKREGIKYVRTERKRRVNKEPQQAPRFTIYEPLMPGTYEIVDGKPEYVIADSVKDLIMKMPVADRIVMLEALQKIVKSK